MAAVRITVSVPAATAKRIRRAAGQKSSISEWVAGAAMRMLEEQDLRSRFLEFCDGLEASPSEEKRAQTSFDRVVGAKKAKREKSSRARGKSAA